MGTYVSCNCKHCKAESKQVRQSHKRSSHRALRRANKKALREGGESPASVSSGYKA